jgi:carbon monoxide dehydrogenase subunit G
MDSFSDYAKRAQDAGSRLTDAPLQMTHTTRLGATQQELFDYISDPDRLSEWIPGAKKTWSDDSKAEAPKQVGSVRMIQGSLGKPTREVVKVYEPPHLLAYSLTRGSTFGLFSDHLGVVTCEPHRDGGTVLCWLAFARPAGRIKWLAGKKIFEVALGGGIKALERKFPYR